MNLNNSPTEDQLAQLLAKCNDNAGNHILWVDQSGDVFIDLVPGGMTPVGFEKSKPTMRMRCETYGQGNGYVGLEVAADADYVAEQLRFLQQGWAGTFRPGQVKFWDGFGL